MNLKLILSTSLVIAAITAFGQNQTKDRDTRVKPKQSLPTSASEKANQKDRPHPLKPAQFISEWMKPSAELKFNDLPYAYNALEPVIDSKTVEIHYDKHHRGYYNNFLAAIKGTDLEKMPITRIFANISSHSSAVRNNAGGFFNHVLYWQNMSPDGGGEPSGELANAINTTFGDFNTFSEKFSEAGKSRFGSGWAWLAIDLNTGDLFITSTANQDNPLMNTAERRGIPILALDVWEHAYYLNYQNKRADYIAAFWEKVNWPDVEAKYNGYKNMREEMKK
jgi:superoxide dismutase, Fe-Mn family